MSPSKKRRLSELGLSQPTKSPENKRLKKEAPEMSQDSQKKSLFKSRLSQQQASQNDSLALNEGIDNSMKRMKLKNEGLGSRRVL